jgi:hypothetical protein
MIQDRHSGLMAKQTGHGDDDTPAGTKNSSSRRVVRGVEGLEAASIAIRRFLSNLDPL